MTWSGWNWVAASVRGTSHANSGTECQDSHLCFEASADEGQVFVALASDGAGSAKYSARGSSLICETLRDVVTEFFAERGRVDLINARLVAGWIERFRSEVILLAEAEGSSEREFACTLLGAVLGSAAACFFQIGDGAIVYSISADGPYRLCFWPNRGDYENTTYFATQANFSEQLQFKLIAESAREIALFSDGLQRLALNYQAQEAHQPFFRGLFPSIRSISPTERAEMNDQLAKFLGSSKVNERTDDDKTLILALSR